MSSLPQLKTEIPRLENGDRIRQTGIPWTKTA